MTELQWESSESLKSLAITALSILRHIFFNGYFLAALAFLGMGQVAGMDFVIENVFATELHLILVTGLIMLAGYGVRQDIKRFKAKNKKISRSMVLVIVIFVYLSMYGEVLNFEIDVQMSMAEHWNSEKLKESNLQFHTTLYGIFAMMPYPFFFYHKEMKEWICKYDKQVEEYEKKMLLKSK